VIRSSEQLGSFLFSGKSNQLTIYSMLGDNAYEAKDKPVYSELYPTALELLKRDNDSRSRQPWPAAWN
jgi:hypothetical protein